MTNILPHHESLNITALNSCFNDVTNSYKFYWFLAILEHIEKSDIYTITDTEISIKMLEFAWYPLDYYKLSFGKADSFIKIAEKISQHITVDNTPNSPSLFSQIENGLSHDAVNKIKTEVNLILNRWVKYRFLRPFLNHELSGLKDTLVNNKIKELVNTKYQTDVPYTFESGGIKLNDKWVDYLRRNNNILKGFIFWNIVRFLNKHNPNVIGLPEKLFKPATRDLKIAKAFWGDYLKENPTDCIYSRVHVPDSNFSLDHYIPWSYVAHDKVWNIVPTTKSMNSIKGDRLPTNFLLNSFLDLQYSAFKYHRTKNKRGLLSDYETLFNLNSNELDLIDADAFKSKISNEIKIYKNAAESLGFSELKL